MHGIAESDVQLQCFDLTNEISPHDEIQLIVGADDVDEAQFTVSENISDGNKFNMAGKLAPFFPGGIRYMNNFVITPIEMDDTDADDVWDTLKGSPAGFTDKGPNSASRTTFTYSGRKTEDITDLISRRATERQVSLPSSPDPLRKFCRKGKLRRNPRRFLVGLQGSRLTAARARPAGLPSLRQRTVPIRGGRSTWGRCLRSRVFESTIARADVLPGHRQTSTSIAPMTM